MCPGWVCVDKACPELIAFLLQPSKCWHFRCVSSHLRGTYCNTTTCLYTVAHKSLLWAKEHRHCYYLFYTWFQKLTHTMYWEGARLKSLPSVSRGLVTKNYPPRPRVCCVAECNAGHCQVCIVNLFLGLIWYPFSLGKVNLMTSLRVLDVFLRFVFLGLHVRFQSHMSLNHKNFFLSTPYAEDLPANVVNKAKHSN